jgi:hypothetical protein
MRLIDWQICASCLIKKSIDDFGKNKSQPGGKHYYCKQCMRERAKKNREQNKDYYKTYREKNKEKLMSYSKEYHKNNREKINEYQRSRPTEKKHKYNEQKKQRDKERGQSESFKRKRNLYYSEKYHSSIQFSTKKKFEARLNYLLEKNDIIESVTLIGCTIPEYKAYLEQRFREGMSWENYGTIWCIRRIIPFTEWNLTNPAEAALCYHYTNSVPLLISLSLIDSDFDLYSE